ncbi:hypothetical protein Tco_0535747 [Tanacetum coccineum]
MSTPKFAETHNLVPFLEKPEESNRFEEVIDFLNVSSIQYALTVNPTIYTTCIEQFWTSAKVKTVNGERQIQGLVDKKNVIISEISIRSVLKLDDAEGTDSYFSSQWKFLIHTILQCLSAKTTSWNEFSSTMASAIICLAINQKFNLSKYIFDNMVKNLDGRVKFLMYPRFVKKSRRKQSKDSAPTKPTIEETTPEEHVSTSSYDPPLSGEDRMQLAELMSLQLEKRRKSRTSGLRRLRKVGSSSRVESLNDASLGAQEDASKQERKIKDLDADAEQEIEFKKVVEEPVVSVATTTKSIPVSTAEVVTTASASVVISDELTFSQTLIEIKTAKPKPVTTAATTVTSVRPRAKEIIFHDQEEQVLASTKTFSSSQSQLPQVKDKGKGKMVEPEVPLKKNDQVALDEEMARNLEAQLQAELIEEERLARKKEEEANIALIESWDNPQDMIEADFELAQRLQAEEQGEITIEERSRLFVELMNRKKKHFTKLRAEEIRRKSPTKAQKRNQISTYLKNMAGFKHSQLKSKSYDEIQKLFDKEMKRVNTFMDMNSEVVKEAEKDNDPEEEEMKKHMEIVQDKEEITIDAIPLATKPPMIIEYKIIKEGQKGFYHLIRADGSSKRHYQLLGCFRIQKMNIKFRGGLLGLKDFKMILRVTTAQVQLPEGLMMSEMRSKTYQRRDKG